MGTKNEGPEYTVCQDYNTGEWRITTAQGDQLGAPFASEQAARAALDKSLQMRELDYRAAVKRI